MEDCFASGSPTPFNLIYNQGIRELNTLLKKRWFAFRLFFFFSFNSEPQ
jgi:hypothetical protein